MVRFADLPIAWIRVIICSGPRQVINALTLYSVYNAKLSVEGNTFESSFSSFFAKLKALAESDYRQAVVLSGMLFTLVIWVFAFLSLVIAALCFVLYLWHIIPRADGGLTGFCERKINKRLKQIVSEKINKAMAEDERKRRKAEIKAAVKNGEEPVKMQPALPTIPSVAMAGGGDRLPEMPMLKRTDTSLTLDTSGRPGTPGSFELNALGQKRMAPSRTDTMNTTTSYSSRAGLLNGAADIGMSPNSPAPSLPTPNGMGGYGPPSRTGTMTSNNSYGPGSQMNRMPSNGSSLREGYSASPAPYPTDGYPTMPVPVRSPTAPPGGYRGPGPNQPNWPNPGQGRATYDDYTGGRASPAPSNQSYGSNPLSPQGMGPNGYPVRSATGPLPLRGPPQRFAPQRNMTAPAPGFAQHQHTGSNGSLRSVPGSARQYHESAGSAEFDPTNRPGTSNSQRPGPGPGPRQPYPQGQQTEGYDYFNRPGTAQSQRAGPGGAQPYQAQGGGDDEYYNRPPTATGQRPGPQGAQQSYQSYQPEATQDYLGRSETFNSQRPSLQQPYAGQGGTDDYLGRSGTSNSQRPNPAPSSYQGSGGPARRTQPLYEQEEDDYMGRSPTSNSQRNQPPRGGYGGGNDGWNQDVERGNGPRY